MPLPGGIEEVCCPDGYAALDFHDIEFAGQPHRGIDDAQNVARILPFMDWSLEAEIITTRETSMRM